MSSDQNSKPQDKSKDVIRDAIKDILNESLQKIEVAPTVKSKDGGKGIKMIESMPVSSTPTDSISYILTALKKSEDTAAIQKLSLDVDPQRNAYNYSSLFKRRNNLIPPVVLKRLRDTEELIGGVILPHRARQLLMFSRPRANRFDVGFVINLKPEAHSALKDIEIKELQDEAIPVLRELLLNCGRNDGLMDREKRSLGQFYMESYEDAGLFGWFAVEIRRDSKNNFHSWRAVDAGTIYQVTAAKRDSQDAENVRKQAERLLKEIYGEKINQAQYDNFSELYTWVQVLDDTPKQVFTDDELIVMNMNPSTDVYRNGYPVSPVERIISAVTTHINLTTHTKLYFVNGRAARNVMVFKSDNLEPQDLDAIKNQMAAHINSVNSSWRMPVFGMGSTDGVEIMPLEQGGRDMEFQYLADLNKRMIFAAYQMSPDEVAALSYLSKGSNSQTLSECLDLETRIITVNGLKSIGELLKNSDSINTSIWTGVKWENARVFKTGEKMLEETKFSNGLSIKTSPDHKFLTVGEDGDPTWKAQSQLKSDDYVLTSKKPVEGHGAIPEYNGKPLTEEMMEVLGWITGDGSIIGPRKRVGAQLNLFYHHDKEYNVWNRHANILSEFGLNFKQIEKILTPQEQEKIKNRYGFKSVASKRIKTIVYDTAFVNWMLSIGFQTSKNGKSIPDCFYTLPIEYRQAFLRGLFSADGGINKKSGSVILTVTKDDLRQQVRELLLTLGISCHSSEGTTKEVFVGVQRKTVKAKNKLYIRDKRSFFSQVGFLQDHKQLNGNALEGCDPSFLPLAVQKKYVNKLIASDLPRKFKKDLYAFLKDDANGISLTRLSQLFKEIDQKLPSWLYDYNFCKVESLTSSGTTVMMADVTLQDSIHAFWANGLIVHNSNNEYKLTAARDVGLRPILMMYEDFFNERLLPKINPKWAKYLRIDLEGLDADSPEKEATRLAQDANIYLTMNEIMERVEKKKLPLAGEFPMNGAYIGLLERYFTKGQILRAFGGPEFKDADKDPNLQYCIGDPTSTQLFAMQNAPQAPQPDQESPAEGEDEGGPKQGGGDLDSALAQLGEALGKSENELPTSRKELLKRHKIAKKKIMDSFSDETDKMIKAIEATVSGKDPHSHEE